MQWSGKITLLEGIKKPLKGRDDNFAKPRKEQRRVLQKPSLAISGEKSRKKRKSAIFFFFGFKFYSYVYVIIVIRNRSLWEK